MNKRHDRILKIVNHRYRDKATNTIGVGKTIYVDFRNKHGKQIS